VQIANASSGVSSKCVHLWTGCGGLLLQTQQRGGGCYPRVPCKTDEPIRMPFFETWSLRARRTNRVLGAGRNSRGDGAIFDVTPARRKSQGTSGEKLARADEPNERCRARRGVLGPMRQRVLMSWDLDPPRKVRSRVDEPAAAGVRRLSWRGWVVEPAAARLAGRVCDRGVRAVRQRHQPRPSPACRCAAISYSCRTQRGLSCHQPRSAPAPPAAGVRPFPTRAARSVVCLAINHDPRRHRCNVKRCRAPPGELRYNDVMYDVTSRVTSRVTSCMT